MAERVVLHIGLMKSGTTFIQRQLGGSRAELRDEGVLFPGRNWSDQVHAVIDFMGYDNRRTARTEGAWLRLHDEVAAYEGTALISMEYLAAVRAPKVKLLVEALGDVPVEVVMTVRDMGRAVPAMWQESLKNGYSWGWQEYVEGIEVEGNPIAQHFWRQQAGARILAKWVEAVGSERMTVVTLPDGSAPRDLLWRRFCEAIDLPVAADWQLRKPANESLGVASCEVLRRLNRLLDGLSVPEYQAQVKRVLGNGALAARKSLEDPIGFQVPSWLAARSANMRELIKASGVRIVGDLDELAPLDVAGADPERVDPTAALDAAMAALETLVRQSVDDDKLEAKKAAKG